MEVNSIINKLKGPFKKSVLKRLKIVCLMIRIKKFRNKVAICIQKYFRGYLVRKELWFLKTDKASLFIKWPETASEVYLAGDFTSPEWELQVPMRYSRVLNFFISTYFVETSLKPDRYHMKFIVDGQWCCNTRMPTSVDMNSNMNNVIEIFREQRNVPRPHSTRNLVPDVFNITKTQNSIEFHRVSSLAHNLCRPLQIDSSDESEKKDIKLVFGQFMAAHPKSRFAPLDAANSADACFTDEDLQIFGVADGVGEWETFGLDPGLFPKELMQHFKSSYELTSSTLGKKTSNFCPMLKILLSEAYNKTKSFGSSTILLGVCQNNTLYTISLGDSTYIILRPREKNGSLFEVFRLIEQQHSFNCPYQLAYFPEPDQYEVLAKKGFGSFVSLLKRSNLEMQDKPQDAKSDTFQVLKGDIVIAASDGLFDNLFDEDIIKISETFLAYGFLPEEFCNKLAKELVSKAVQKGWDMTYRSPFSKNAAKFGQRFIGGKLDDTSVVVAMCVDKD